LLFGKKDGKSNPIVTRAVPYHASVRKRSHVIYNSEHLDRRVRQLEAPNSRYLGTCHSHVEIAGTAFRRLSQDDVNVFLHDRSADFDMLVTVSAVHPSVQTKPLTKDLMHIEPIDDKVSYKFVIAARHKQYGYPEKLKVLAA